MRASLSLTCLVVAITSFASPAGAQEPPLPPPDRTPILILDHAGPRSPVTAIAFSPDASTLYVGGFDKLVRRYSLRNGRYIPVEPLRIPLGQGNAGVVNAVAVSPDGKWIAVAGRAPVRGEVWSGSDDGIVTKTQFLPPLVKRDFGVVYLFDVDNPQGGKVIRGLQSEVRALAFANPAPATGAALIAAGIEWDADDKKFGTVRVFDVATGKETDFRRDFPATTTPPGLAAWAVGPGGKRLRVAVAWEKGEAKKSEELLVWDAPGGELQRLQDAAYNGPLAVRVGKAGATEVVTAGFQTTGNFGQLAVRAADPMGKEKVVRLVGQPGQFLLPLAIAPLTVKDVGDAAAVLVRVTPKPVGATSRPTELRLLGPAGDARIIVSLTGISDESAPVLAASPDGRYVAVGGYSDNRVEVFATADLAAGKPVVERLPGDTDGFSRTRFLVGNKLWLGRATDAPTRGGVVLDLVPRTATPNDGKALVDAPPAGVDPILENPDATKKLPGRVAVTVGGVGRVISLADGERPTVAAFHPGKPTWEPALGPIVAVAHTDDKTSLTLITIFDAANGKRLLQLGGPTLSVRSLAFSGTRSLLAAAGDDGTVFVWSLRDLSRAFPTVDGVTVTSGERGIVVASVDPKSGSNGKLGAGDVIEKLGGEKGELKAVATPAEFVLVVRGLPVGGSARVQIKGQAAPVVVPVVSAVGHRHPLFTLWVAPVANEGQHNWIGWTAAGPYDTNSAAAEAKIGWLTATGNPARPVAFAAAGQYRKEYYKKDFFRFLTDEADISAALKRWIGENPPRVPALRASLTVPVEKQSGKLVTREKADGLDVSLGDTAELVDLDRAVLRWRVAGEWQQVPFAAGRAVIDLKGYAWTRGENRFQLALHPSPDAAPVVEATTPFSYIPPAPHLTVQIDNKAVKANEELTTKNGEVELSVKATPEGGGVVVGLASITLTTTGPDGDKPLSLVEQKGHFLPVKVRLNPPPAKTVIRVTATARGEGVDPKLESDSSEVTVRQLPPDPVPPPKVTLTLSTPHELPVTLLEPRVTHATKITLAAAIEDANAVDAFEWDLGDAKWLPGKLDTKTREVALPLDSAPITIRVRAKSKNSPFAEDSVRVVFAGLAEPTLTLPPMHTTQSDLVLTGDLKVTGDLAPTLRVVVASLRTGRSKEVEAAVDVKAKTWRASIELSPGENEIGLIVRNRWAESRKPVAARITHLRPPMIAFVRDLDVGTASVGDVTALVANHPGVDPTALRVNDGAVAFRRQGEPFAALGYEWSLLKAEGVSVMSLDGKRLKTIDLVVGNAEGNSSVARIGVQGMDPVPVQPPTVALAHNGNAVGHKQEIRTDQPRFALGLEVTSEKPITRAEVWRGGGSNNVMEPVGGIDPKLGVAGPVGHRLAARATFDLRRGLNRIRVVVANGEKVAEVEFLVSYNPPPVRVMIDSISEVTQGRKLVPLKLPTEGPVVASGPVLEIRGRVVWDTDDDPVSRDPNLAVVLVANRVAHLPIRPDQAAEGRKERAFVAPVFVNAKTSRIRVELRSGDRAGTLPQQGYGQTELGVECKNPLDERTQRLHLLIIAPEVGQRERASLGRRVIEALNGTIPEDRPGFDHGEFKHALFARAVLYRPLVHDVDQSDVVGLLKEVEREIRQTTGRKGEEWLNDVVLVYYQGRDHAGKEGLLLHTTRSLVYDGDAASTFMIRVSDLSPTPGVQLGVLNVIELGRPLTLGNTLGAAMPLLRYPWKDSAGIARLPSLLKDAMTRERTLGRVVEWVRGEVGKSGDRSGDLLEARPLEIRARVIGTGRP